jgi:hypothetical protein
MLFYQKPALSQVRRVTGQYLAKNRLGKRDRALLAARIISGTVEIKNLTHKQVAALCRVSTAYVDLVRKPVPAMPPLPRLVAAWKRSTDAERRSLAQHYEDQVWAALEVTNDKAAEPVVLHVVDIAPKRAVELAKI